MACIVQLLFQIFLLSYFLEGKKKEVKKETGLGLTHKKDENFGEWYSEVSPNSRSHILFY